MAKSKVVKPKKRSALPAIPGAKAAEFPGFVPPSLATLKTHFPAWGTWTYEIKFDGYRGQAHLQNGLAAIFTRNGHDWTEKFSTIANEIALLPAKELILDGEIVVPNAKGIPDLSLLQKDAASGRTDRLVYYAFDILYLDGYDLRPALLQDRKRLLADLLKSTHLTRIALSENIEGNISEIFEHACAMGLEGIICKNNTRYTSGRNENWIKRKCNKTEVLYIVGFCFGKGNKIGSVFLARKNRRTYEYAGKASTGFSVRNSGELAALFNGLVTEKPPFPAESSGIIWLRPKLRAKIQYLEKTENSLRHASFKELVYE